MKDAEDARYKNVTRGSTGFPSKPFSIPCRSRSWIFCWMTEAYSSPKPPPAMEKMRCQLEFKSHLHLLPEPFVDFLLEAQSSPKPPPAMGKMRCQPEFKSHAQISRQKITITRFYLALRKWSFGGLFEGVYVCMCDESLFCRLLDVKHIENKDGKAVLFLVFEYMDSDLKKYIETYRCSHTKMHPDVIKSFMYQLCRGVSYCHSCGVMHRDLNLITRWWTRKRAC